jgi:hypothetical protein
MPFSRANSAKEKYGKDAVSRNLRKVRAVTEA